MKKITVFLLVVVFVACSSPETKVSELAAGFENPGKDERPHAYWNWLNGDVSFEGLTYDLEEAKDKGLGGLQMWDTEAMRNSNGFVPSGPPFMGTESVAAMQHAIKEAKRLDLNLGLITSSGWNAGGPWVKPEMASKNLYYSSIVVNGPGQIKKKLPFPEVARRCPKGEDGLPLWYLDVAVLAWPNSEDKVIPDISEVINISDKFKDGELNWTPPEGQWQVIRYVCSNSGQMLIAASPNSKGPFIDFLDPEATRFHFMYIIEKLGLKKGGDPNHPLKTLDVDSMELPDGIQWTTKFREWFMKYHSYDPIAWLPTLSGWTINSKDESARFIYDYQNTVSDLLIFSHYTTGSEICAEYGLQLAGEAGGPGPPIWYSCPVDALKALGNVDIPRGEFWIRNRNNIFLIKEIASASHIYGKKYVDAESWTTWWRWKDSPFVRKQWVDRAFCEGLNRVTYHGYSNSPEEFGYPGRSYHAGVDMNTRVVWWSKARPFMDYLARCCQMLQQGKFVADVAYFYGDQAPNFWPLFANVPEKPLLDGLGAGYDYDVVNSDVILNRMSVEDGRIVLPDGMSYLVLVLPDQPYMPLEVLVKLEDMVANGATIIGSKPLDVPGLQDYEARSLELKTLASKMWESCDGTTVTQNNYGKGKVVCGMSSREWLMEESVKPDFFCQVEEHKSDLDYIHRKTEDTDIYFVRNKSLKPLTVDCFFRVEDSRPQLWDPTDGNMKTVFVYDEVDGGTNVELELPAGGSIFVVFGNVAEIENDAFQCWENGTYTVVNNKGREKELIVDDLPSPIEIEGEWTVNFDQEWGAPAEVKFPELISWPDHDNEGIKYYSGAGFYTKSMDVPADWLASGRKVYLDLGEVRELAEVFVNGKSAGVLWNPPYKADITELVKAGSNDIKIEVMNLWCNRLAGDNELPEDERFTSTNITTHGYRTDPNYWLLQPAGLLGPVRLVPSVLINP
ncbi:MAG: hypothetical protein HN352_07205 [Bacteroidetes bacterium]|jgi:hypothetical protein|nr:hypothetical protein [Bacteroidota bacterium]MBT4412219.1 hypothetical protein [Bacteroidota bacterium]MBT7463953.1 hypothetical protein [Bacteroidota bacterium]